MKIKNKVSVCSNYATSALQDELNEFADAGYKLVSTQLAKNRYGDDVMYLFFTKEEQE